MNYRQLRNRALIKDRKIYNEMVSMYIDFNVDESDGMILLELKWKDRRKKNGTRKVR